LAPRLLSNSKKLNIPVMFGLCQKDLTMKSRKCLFTLVGLVSWSLAAFAQTNQPAGELPATPASVTATQDAAPPATPPTTPAEPAKEPAVEAPAVAAVDPAQPAATPATPAAEAATTGTNAAPAGTNAVSVGTNAAPGGIIPLIVMDDVPLTDAIKNLARQAALNYMLDPKVSFGQPGPDGKPGAQPTVSIRWENVTAEQALTALLNNYSLQLVEDPKSKIARITVKDPAAPDPLVTKVIQLKYASPTNIMSAVQNTFSDKRSKVVADVRTSQLVVLATEKELVDVDQLVERLDTQTKQVLIEARLLETTINPHTDKGIDWSGTLSAQNFAFGNNRQFSPVPGGSENPPLATLWPRLMADTARGFNPATAFLNADGVSAVLSFLNTYGETKVISTPRTVTLDNEMAIIEVGEMHPIVNVTAGTANTTGGSQINYSNLTVRLDVTPRISANDFVNLRVVPRVMRLGSPVTSLVAGQANKVDSFLTRSLNTVVMIPSGNTLVMGGLIDDNVNINNVKVPLLGDIPVVGLLFRHDSKDRKKNNLIVFVTPTIVQDQDFQPTTTDYLKTPVPTSDSVDGDWSSWDSGKPKDWSKPEQKAADTGAKFSAVPSSSTH
jgi:type II secretory pathway component GspD/PulD (secretin)